MLKKILFAPQQLESGLAHIGLLILRVVAGLSMAFAHGTGKIPPADQFVGFLTSLKLPFPEFMAWGAGLSEFVGGLLIALGLLTRASGLSLVVTMAVAAFLAHGADPFAKKEMALLYLSIFAMLAFAGPGKYSVDRIILKKY